MFAQRGVPRELPGPQTEGMRGRMEERVSKIREYNINVGEIKERDKLRTRKRDRVLRTEVGWGLKKKEVTREKTEN